jgi:NAD+ diphosphatase
MGQLMSQSFLARLPLARWEVDRDYRARESDDDIQALLAAPSTRFLPLHDGSALLRDVTELALVSADELPPTELVVYLGRSLSSTPREPSGTAIFAAVLAEPAGLPGEWGNLRTLGAALSERDAGIFAQALAITNWHATMKFSPLSGAPITVSKAGWVLTDSVTGSEHFPRTDMAVIVGVTDADDRILLGRNAQWESNRFSLLAGFVEPGESLEAAVAREVFEESGIRVTDPVYLGSQPWPFPASLMLGFMARVDGSVQSVLAPDGVEIMELRWFSRAELLAAIGHIRLPGTTSIARAIIEEWYGSELPEPAT